MILFTDKDGDELLVDSNNYVISRNKSLLYIDFLQGRTLKVEFEGEDEAKLHMHEIVAFKLGGGRWLYKANCYLCKWAS